MTISTMDPHTTSKHTRTCKECHSSSRILGLGAGQLIAEPKDNGTGVSWDFAPAVRAKDDFSGIAAFVKIDGTPLVHTSRKWLRTFNGSEIKRILDAGLCVGCHDKYDDPVMDAWHPETPPEPCEEGMKIINIRDSNHQD